MQVCVCVYIQTLLSRIFLASLFYSILGGRVSIEARTRQYGCLVCLITYIFTAEIMGRRKCGEARETNPSDTPRGGLRDLVVGASFLGHSSSLSVAALVLYSRLYSAANPGFRKFKLLLCLSNPWLLGPV